MKLKKLLKMICPKTKIEVVQDYDYVIEPNEYKEKGCFEVEAFDVKKGTDVLIVHVSSSDFYYDEDKEKWKKYPSY